MTLDSYPFDSLRTLLTNSTANTEKTQIDLTIGEPKFATPSFICEALSNHAPTLNKYPPNAGAPELANAIGGFVKRRFDITLSAEQFCPTFGTKEVCFNFPSYYLHDKKEPTMAFVNPYYAVYKGAAVAAKAKIVTIDLLPDNDFKPKMSEEQLQNLDLVILNFPNNPTGCELSLEELQEWVKLALKHDFFLINDECYSEIYRQTPPPSLLQASVSVGNASFKNIAVLNSLSKRSSAPSIRGGFIAGDASVLKGYKVYRTYTGTTPPLPNQLASAEAWEDEHYPSLFRDKYNKNFEHAHDILGVGIPSSGFFLWLAVPERYNGDDLLFTKELFERENIKVLPGSFLCDNDVSRGYVRIAFVYEEQIIREAMQRLSVFVRA